MKFITFRRWSELSYRGRLLGGIGIFTGLLLLGLGIGYITNSSETGDLGVSISLPAQAAADRQSLSVEVESQPPQPMENYFVNYRLQREQSRQEAKVMLAPLLNSDVRKNREDAQQKWLDLTQKIERESRIENLLKIKGFKDAVADAGSQGVHVIVQGSQLSPEEVRLIQSIVIQLTNVRIDKISISIRP